MARKEAQPEVKEDVVEKPTPKLRYSIETPNGVYKVKRPVGRAGVVHFTLVSKSIPTRTDPETGDVIITPDDQDRFTKAFDEWTVKVLPEIYIEGPFPLKEMPGEDQYALFLAMFTTVNLGGQDLFRFID